MSEESKLTEEEILDQTPIHTDSRGKFTNSSADTFANNGLRGKLSEEQLEERAILHAKRQVTGQPTVAAIIKKWANEGVTMSVSSEYEWYKNNTKRVEAAISLLEETGGMPIVSVPDSALSASLATGARSMLDQIRTNKKTAQKVQTELDDMTDFYYMIGAQNKEGYYKASDEQRAIFDERLKNILAIKDSHVNVFNAMTKSSAESGKVLIETMKAVSSLNKQGSTFDRMLEKKVNDAIKEKGLKLQEDKAKEEASPLDPISDDERAN